jgi:alkanesulfonate monooxygenase SsuD/methylene tetrahydromethanopterin reductase-like flavin-dependent oxidoreductase (luciferase family)
MATEPVLDVGIFQLLPAPENLADREVIAQALWEVDCAESGGFDSVWVTEHHLSSFGLIGTPSVYAAAVAQRTRRVAIGYAIAVVPLHHPLRLAEEIAWVDALSGGRVLVGLGPGFSPYEFGAFGVPLEERQARLAEGSAIVRGALTQERFQHRGRFWTIPEVTLRPRPAPDLGRRFFRASSSNESLHEAALAGLPVLLGLKPLGEIGERIDAYRAVRAGLGIPAQQIDREVAEFRILRRVCVAASDEQAWADARGALAWETATARRVHEAGGKGEGSATLADGSSVTEVPEVPGGCIGTPETVTRELLALRALGIRHVIAWVNFGDMPYPKVRRSMEWLQSQVVPALAHPDVDDLAAAPLTSGCQG